VDTYCKLELLISIILRFFVFVIIIFLLIKLLQNVLLIIFRAKEVDVIPYITTRLVDDFASHIRLYRRSLGKVIEHRKDGNLKFCVFNLMHSFQLLQ